MLLFIDFEYIYCDYYFEYNINVHLLRDHTAKYDKLIPRARDPTLDYKGTIKNGCCSTCHRDSTSVTLYSTSLCTASTSPHILVYNQSLHSFYKSSYSSIQSKDARIICMLVCIVDFHTSAHFWWHSEGC